MKDMHQKRFDLKKNQPPPHNHKSTTKNLLILISLKSSSFNKSFQNKAFQSNSFKYCIDTSVLDWDVFEAHQSKYSMLLTEDIEILWKKLFPDRSIYIVYIQDTHQLHSTINMATKNLSHFCHVFLKTHT